jgi:hypothetical protein
MRRDTDGRHPGEMIRLNPKLRLRKPILGAV